MNDNLWQIWILRFIEEPVRIVLLPCLLNVTQSLPCSLVLYVVLSDTVMQQTDFWPSGTICS